MTNSPAFDMQPLDIWVSDRLFLPDKQTRPCPLMMHLTQADTDPEALFWNPLREVLPRLVRVHRFEKLADAGDVVVIPQLAREWVGLRKTKQLRDMVRRIVASGRTVVTFVGGAEYTPLPGEIAFAAAAYDSPRETVNPIPNWLYDIGDFITPIARPKTPTIAFVGNTLYPSRLNSLLRFIQLPEPLLFQAALSRKLGRFLDLKYRFVLARCFRQRVLQAVRGASNLCSHLVERGNLFSFSDSDKAKARAEFLQAVQDNAYMLCMRGDANSDFRTWEVLSAGRIPVIVDTKQKLPHLEGMRWEDFCVFVPPTELNRIGEIIGEYHAGLSEDDFQEKCRMARAAFEQLMPHRYIRRVIQTIRLHTATEVR
ncbi:MAG: glycosyltransferase family 47 protein, partial [Cytophagales bacterium]|nr:glycosyltransferase family 47 protein [Cytophagales bacterium]